VEHALIGKLAHIQNHGAFDKIAQELVAVTGNHSQNQQNTHLSKSPSTKAINQTHHYDKTLGEYVPDKTN
jgi:hypothetical protein